jgi:hypothetical protein
MAFELRTNAAVITAEGCTNCRISHPVPRWDPIDLNPVAATEFFCHGSQL